MNLYAALIGLLQTQKEYRETELQSVVVFLRPGPERYAQPFYAHKLTGDRESVYPYEVIKLWETEVEALLHRFPAPWAVLGPFCAGDLVQNVLTSSRVLEAARPAMQRERWDELREYFRFVIAATARRPEDMERLRDIIKKEDVEDFWIYQYLREQILEETREQALKEAREQALKETREQERNSTLGMLTMFLEQKFGTVPSEIHTRLQALQTVDDVKEVMKRAFHAAKIEDAF